MIQAHDVATNRKDADKIVPQVQTELLRLVNPEKIKSIPGLLPLYVGMRVTLQSKDCVRFGLVKGCTCTVEKIVLAGREPRPENVVAGHVHYLRYMLVSLLLRAEGEQWTLPATELPKDLFEEFDRVGCFQLRPTYDYLSTTWEDERLLVGPNIY